jgi:TonB family protein
MITSQENTYTKNIIENNEKIISDNLYNVFFDENDYIKLTGKAALSGKLFDIEIEQAHISAQKANTIIEKLKTISNLQIPAGYNKFDLYLYSKPKYSVYKGPVVIFDLTNDNISNTLKNNKKLVKNYYDNIYFNKIYAKWVLLNKKYNNFAKPVYVKAKVDRAGNLLSYQLFKSSGNQQYDEDIIKIIKSSAPFNAFNIENLQTLDLMFEFNKNIDIDSKVKANFINVPAKEFEGIVKVKLDKYGDITESAIARTTNDETIDRQMLLAVQKTGNFFETISYDEKSPFVKYIIFRQAIIKGAKPITQIIYFTFGDEPTASQIEAIKFANIVEYIVKSNWLPPSLKESYTLTALFVMNKEGRVTTSSIIKSSNIQEADNSVLRAINTAKLPKIPEDFNKEYVPIEMTFDYALDPNINPILKELYFQK